MSLLKKIPTVSKAIMLGEDGTLSRTRIVDCRCAVICKPSTELETIISRKMCFSRFALHQKKTNMPGAQRKFTRGSMSVIVPELS